MPIHGRGVIFNGRDLGEWGVVESIERGIMGAISVDTRTVPSMRGARYMGSKMGPLDITCAVRLICESKEHLRSRLGELAAIMDVDEPKQLRISDEPGRFRLAVPTKVDVAEELYNTALVRIDFTCPDPLAYGDILHSVRLWTSSATATAHVGGTAPTKPTIRLVNLRSTGTTAADAYFRDDTGVRLGVKAPTSYTTYRIDCEQRNVEVGIGQTANGMLLLDADWYEWQPGEHSVTPISTDYATVIAVFAEWRDRWY